MSTPIWQPGTLYAPGALVVPRTKPPTTITQPANPGFESGDLTGWSTADGARWAVQSSGAYEGSHCVQVSGDGITSLVNGTYAPIDPGQLASVQALAKITNAGTDDAHAQVVLEWWSDSALLDFIPGNEIQGKGGSWKTSTASGKAPGGTTRFRLSLSTNPGSHGSTVAWDAASYTYAIQTIPDGLVYEATQAKAGRSATSEPDWPGNTTTPVTDNEVTWQGKIASRVVWTAAPICQSGSTEPTWPTDVGGQVSDGVMAWKAVSRRVIDANCPNSKVVAIMASKVFAADDDIVRFSATVNPLDWSSTQDAGYLPTGLQQANANGMAVLAPYRSNLTAFNASSFQNWQVDPDPSAMALLDQMEGIGSVYQHAAQPVGNELFYLSQLGVRSVSIAAGADSLSAGDVGMPVDSLVQAAVKLDATLLGPRAAYYPSAGQYLLACDATSADGGPQVFVFTRAGGKGKWSRYVYPFSVDAFALKGNDLYIRHGDVVSQVTDALDTDEVDGAAVPFVGAVQWHWLDDGQPGVTKMLESVDYVGTGQGPALSIGYDQRSLSAFTAPYTIDADTLPGTPVPIPVAAPTFSVRLAFAGGAAWAVNQVTLHLADMPGQP